MAFDYFLQIDRVDGESRDQRHARWIDCMDAQFEIRLPTYAQYGVDAPPDAGTVVTADNSRPQAFRVRARTSAATPRLIALSDSGGRRSAAFEAVRQGPSPQRVYRLVFTGLQVVRVQTQLGQDGLTDTYDLAYQSIEVTVWPLLGNGALGTPVATILTTTPFGVT